MPPPASEQPIDRYLAGVRAQLRGCSADWQDEQIAELRSHIESLANDRVDIDPASNEALADALLRLGDPRTIGSELRREWLRDAGKWAIKNLLCWAGSLV